MSQELTLDQVTPRVPLHKKVLLGCLGLFIAAILVVTYVSTEINPLKLYEKHQNAFTYLFGHELSQHEKDTALAQAKRLPEVIILQEAMGDIRAQMKAEGNELDFTEMNQRAKALAAERSAQMPTAKRDAIVEREYAHQLDEKRGGFFPPESRIKKVQRYTESLLETIAIAIWGTLIAFVAAIPVAMLAARNTLKLLIPGNTGSRVALRNSIQFGVRRILDFCRGFNEFVMALIFVAVIGLGPFAGVLALAIHTFGILGKVISEAIEAIEKGQVEAVEASGAGAVQTMAFSVLPQVMPLIVSYSLLRFESNVRSATILGFVGAGGIGFLIFDKLNGYMYREVCTMMILVILSVTIIDYFCGMLRRRVV